MSRHRGRVVQALARKLQEQFPVHEFFDRDRVKQSVPLLWKAENLYAAKGAYRTNQTLDCWRWEGWCEGARPDGTTYNLWHVGGYTTMTELIRPGDLAIGTDGEVTINRCVEESTACPLCGEDGGTSCGMPNCGLLK